VIGRLEAGKPCPLCQRLVTDVDAHRCHVEIGSFVSTELGNVHVEASRPRAGFHHQVWVSHCHRAAPITPEGARQLARLLVEAAHVAEGRPRIEGPPAIALAAMASRDPRSGARDAARQVVELGDALAAAAHLAHGAGISPAATAVMLRALFVALEKWPCANCDQMLPSREALERHQHQAEIDGACPQVQS